LLIPALEEPKLLVEDLRGSFDGLSWFFGTVSAIDYEE